jgi:hypothetical protein
MKLCLELGSTSLLLEKVQEDRKSTSLFSEVGNDTARSTDSLLDAAVVLELGKTTHGTEFLSGFDHDNVDFTFGAEGLDELLVFLILAILRQAAKTSGTTIEGLGALVESLLQATMDHGLLEDLITEIFDKQNVRDFQDNN